MEPRAHHLAARSALPFVFFWTGLELFQLRRGCEHGSTDSFHEFNKDILSERSKLSKSVTAVHWLNGDIMLI